MGLTGRKPGNGTAAGSSASVMVSPIFVSPTSLMAAIRIPTSPGPRDATSSARGASTARRVTMKSLPVAIMRMGWPFRSSPSKTRTSTTAPWYGSNHESKMSAVVGLFASPTGGGTSRTIASRMSSVPMPSLALARMACEASSPIASSISRRAFSGSALGRSILFSTGTMARSLSSAR